MSFFFNYCSHSARTEEVLGIRGSIIGITFLFGELVVNRSLEYSSRDAYFASKATLVAVNACSAVHFLGCLF